MLRFALAVIAVLLVHPESRAQARNPIPPPLSAATAQFFKSHPTAWRQFLMQLPQRPTGAPASPEIAPAAEGTWTAVTTAPASGLSNPLLLTDGTVLVHESETPDWYKLTPDITGDYALGSWSRIASLPVIDGTQYEPLYFASAVLPDGRVIIMGGEYNGSGGTVWISMGAIYDPAADMWTAVSPPAGAGWTRSGDSGGIGDAPSIVLPDGTFLLGGCCADPDVDALFDAATLSWSSTGAPLGDTYQDEQGYVLLPTGEVLTIDVWDPPNAEVYRPDAGVWSRIAAPPVALPDPCGLGEIGPALTRSDGTVVAFGGNTGCNGQADPTAIYDAANRSWKRGPDVPAACGPGGTENCTLADAPAALLPNGNVLFAASAGAYNSPTHFFEFTGGNAIRQVPDTRFFAGSSSSYFYNFLVLPSGQVLETDFSSTPELYTPSGAAASGRRPVIASVPHALAPGQTYRIAGTQMNGLSQGAAYGDDAEGATNYPIVLIVNSATGHHFFAKTSRSSTTSIAPGTGSTAKFAVAPATETGPGILYVIANGVASTGVEVTVGTGFPLSLSESGSGTVTSAPAGIDCPGTCDANFAARTRVTLTAAPAAGWRFSGWGGACAGIGACKVTVNAAKSVAATFTQFFGLTVSKSGRGRVTSRPAGIACGKNCSADFAAATTVALRASAAAGWHFAGWGGACSGTARCRVSLEAAAGVTALFEK